MKKDKNRKSYNFLLTSRKIIIFISLSEDVKEMEESLSSFFIIKSIII